MLHSVAIIAVAAIVTLIIRAVPFVAFDGKREVPETVTYLGKVLPPAIMVILVIYCVKGINLFTGSHGIPELLSIAVVALLHIWRLFFSLFTLFFYEIKCYNERNRNKMREKQKIKWKTITKN